MWWKKNKWKVIIPVLIVAVLAAAFYYGGDSAGSHGWRVKPAPSAENAEQTAPAPDGAPSGGDAAKPSDPTPAAPADKTDTTPATPDKADEPSGGDAKPEDPGKADEPGKPEDPEKPDEPENGEKPGEGEKPDDPEPEPEPEPKPEPEPEPEPTCTISISCTTILDNMDMCDPDKVELIPSSGWILGPVTVTFTEGETVFDVLQRVCRDYGIHFEYSISPVYNSVYIEGINNIYQFDVGELSGWMYSVNGWFPNFGCGLYTVENDDVIRWVYTCDLGYDVGGGYAS